MTGRKIIVTCESLKDKLEDPSYDRVLQNVAQQYGSLRKQLEAFVSGVIRDRRTPATHILVIMISPEERNRKPYALPVQCLSYKGLKDMTVRSLADKVIKEMTDRGMKVAAG